VSAAKSTPRPKPQTFHGYAIVDKSTGKVALWESDVWPLIEASHGLAWAHCRPGVEEVVECEVVVRPRGKR
jgi:hypothetical protein